MAALKSVLAAITLLTASAIYAEEPPHIVPAQGCEEGQTCCPSVIFCSYDAGCGDTSPWSLAGSSSPFEGVQELKLYQLFSAARSDSGYIAACYYQNSALKIETVQLNNNSKFDLLGNWVYGFNKQTAICVTNDPLKCTFKNQF